ncbi:MAG: tRNA (adenosine(37)-N6)-threonylcarbamoyltransferase complex ATPase subunit type 1 TsaE, partial [Prochlorococcaceae cyanobacterium]
MSQNVAIEVCQLADAAATAALGRELARRLLAAAGAGPALVLLLEGDLGAGKTTLVQGLAEGLGITEPITSPTFARPQPPP